ncbi:Phenol hydroxylase [Colletotrichum sp. SAR 10_66]|nr:Phenol hydroxylase [Colletotrichum sp. SAR 10_66]
MEADTPPIASLNIKLDANSVLEPDENNDLDPALEEPELPPPPPPPPAKAPKGSPLEWLYFPTKGLAGTITLDEILPSTVPITTTGGFETLCSYNWVDTKDPTIIVPGKWIQVNPTDIYPPDPVLPVRIKRDTGYTFCDLNRAKAPRQPFKGLFTALAVMSPNTKLDDVDVILTRGAFQTLHKFVKSGCSTAFILQMNVINKTLVLTYREEKNKRASSRKSPSWGHAFEEGFTAYDDDLKESLAHHRAIKYQFGSLKVAVLHEATDVLIVGAGPVGLVTALGLAQQGIDTVIIEKRELEVQESFGRAITLFPRTLELLEQVGVAEDMVQAGNVARGIAAYQEGKRTPAVGQQTMFTAMNGTFHNYVLNIRQKNSQAIFAAKYKAVSGNDVQYQWELIDYQIDQSPQDGYNITAVLQHPQHGRSSVRCKYLVGADGVQSQVRQLAKIEMVGDETAYEWVRFDGRIKTDVPDTELGFVTIQSAEYGNVFLVRLDKDVFRIGYVFTPGLKAKYPDGLTKEQALEEGLKSFHPFKVEFERLDWWTIYTIRQKVAETMSKDEFVFLAGDAAHTHSSGFGQGMNTGVHDAINLSWKLAGVIRGLYQSGVLDTYSEERRAVAQKVIDIDKTLAAVMSGDLPETWNGCSGKPEHSKVLGDLLTSNASFNIGFGVSYGPSIIVDKACTGSLAVGYRTPDVLLKSPGACTPIRLQSIIHKNTGKWNLLIFAGRPFQHREKLTALREALKSTNSLTKHAQTLSLTTIVSGTISNTWDVFDGLPPSFVYCDVDGQGHNSYGMSATSGGLVVLRPDGFLAATYPIEDIQEVAAFLDGFYSDNTKALPIV